MTPDSQTLHSTGAHLPRPAGTVATHVSRDPKSKALELFESTFGRSASCVASAPGRVNIIGEHTDYNDGFVMPMAIGQRTVIACRPRPEGERVSRLCFPDMGDPRPVEVEMTPRFARQAAASANYLLAVYGRVWETLSLPRRADLPSAIDAVVTSTVPLGAGLSSSAAIEVATARALLAMAGVDEIPGERLALLCQAAEHDVGVPCGIMDQFISTLGRPGAALLIDCRDHGYELVEFSDESIAFVVADCRVKHSLGDGEYAKRRAECESAVEVLRAEFGERIGALRDASMDDLYAVETGLSDVERRRARHVIGEIARTTDAAAAFRAADYALAGELMNASHDSLRDDYEVSCAELDALVESARACEGVFGSRMTGGGFGGCTVTLVDAARSEALIEKLTSDAERDGRPTPACFVTSPSAGARVDRRPA
ncbi:MAG: galactokinase [Phycisphaeraceae bacterium]|nr:MAG: galactokinase [Phycisphaeraceae bacterium]